MADNIELNAGTGGAIVKTDDDGVAHWQYVKLAYGPDNTQNIVGSIASNPLPVQLSSVDNAVLDNIQTAVELIDNAVSGAGFNITQLAGATVPIGAGLEATALRVTLATDSTGVLSIDDNGGSLTIDGTVTANLSVADNAVLDQIQTNTANLTNCIIQDDAPFTPATGYLMMVGGEHDDVAPDSVDEGDAGNFRISANRNLYVQIRDAAGNERGLNINASGELGITNNGTFVVQEDGAALTALQLLDDTVYVDDADWTALTSKHALIGGIFQSTPGTITDGDTGPIRLTANGAVHISDAGGSITVDGTVTANPASGTIDTVTTVSTVTNLAQMGGVAISLNTGVRDTGTQRVTIATNDLVPVTGTITAVTDITNTIDSTISGDALTALQLIDDSLFADDAAFTLTTSKVTMAGAIRDDSLSTLTAIEGDAVPLRVSSTGALHVTGAGGGTQYNIDDAGGATDTGTLLLAIRDDSLTTLTPIDGDYVGLRVNSTGALHVTGGGGGTEYTEDVATANPIVGTATLMERDDALTTVTPIEGDWIGLRGSAEGALWVQDFNSDAILADTTTIAGDTTSIDGKITACNTGAVVIASGTITAVTDITNTIDSTISGDALTALQLIDNPVLVDDAAFTPATSSVMMAGFEYDDITPDSVDEGDAGAARMSANRNIYTQIRDAAGNERGANVNASNQLTVSVDNTVTVGSHAVTNAGTFAVQVDGNALTALQLIDNPIVAHDAAASGATGVSMAGAYATNSIEGLTQVAAADAARLISDLNGVLVVRNGTTLEELISERVSDTAGTSTNFTNFAAGGAGVHNYITDVTIHNAHASTNGYVDLRDGSAGAIKWTFPAPANGGVTHHFDPPLKFAANTAVAYDVSAAITTVYISVNGYQAQG